MSGDVRTLQAAAHEAQARANTARKYAEEAQAARHWPGALPCRHADAEKALERFLTATDDAERARRALRVATEQTRESA